MQVELPSCRSPREEAVLRKEIAFLCLSLKAEIDQFHLEEEREEQRELVIYFWVRRCAHKQQFRGRRKGNVSEYEERFP